MKQSKPRYLKPMAAVATVFCLLFVTPKAKAQWSQFGSTDTATAHGLPTNGLIVLRASDAKGNVYASVFNNGRLYIAKWNGKVWNEFSDSNATASSTEIMITDANGNVYVPGNYKNAKGISHTHIAKWNGKEWSGLGDKNDTTFNNGYIKSIAIDNYGNVYAAVVVDDRNIKLRRWRYSYVVKWDGKVWTILGGKEGFAINDGNTTIKTIAADGKGNLYAGGSLNNDESGQRSFVAKWNGKSWGDLGESQNSLRGSISDIITDAKGNLYALLGIGNMIPVQYVAKWDGKVWSQLVDKSAPRFGGVCSSITTDANGTLYAYVMGLDFEKGPSNPKKNYVANWNGAEWKELGEGKESPFNNPKNRFGGNLTKIFTDASGNLNALGTFYNESGKYYIAKYKQ